MRKAAACRTCQLRQRRPQTQALSGLGNLSGETKVLLIGSLVVAGLIWFNLKGVN